MDVAGGGVPLTGGGALDTVKSRSRTVALPDASMTRTVNWCGPDEKEPGLSVHWNGPRESTAVSCPSTQNSTRCVAAFFAILASTTTEDDTTALSANPLSVASGGGVLGTVTSKL